MPHFQRPVYANFNCSLNPIVKYTRILALTPVFLPGEIHGQKSLVGYSPYGLKELEVTEAT